MSSLNSNKKNWKVNSGGRLIFLAYYIFCATFIIFLLLFRNADGRSIQESIEVFLMTLSCGFPITIGVYALPSYWILKKKVPRSVTLDESGINLGYKNGKIINSRKENTAFSIYCKKGYSYIIFYNKMKSRRGHTVYKEMADLMGVDVTNSWKSSVIENIALELEDAGYENRKIKDKKGFTVRLLG